jgi:large subunit ribosomal protein L17
MRHRVHGRKLGRTTPHRRALLRNLCTSLFEHGRITTTVQKAKEVRPVAERLITLGKRDTLHARRRAAGFLLKAAVVQELFGTIAARYADRNGGYTRIVKLGSRSGDGADLAIIELLGSELAVKKAEQAAAEKTRKEKKSEDEGAEGTAAQAAGDESVAKKISKKIKGALKGKASSKPPKTKKAARDRSKKTASDDSKAD